jgi:hypothetical protein
MPPVIVRCSHLLENLFAQALGCGGGAPFASPSIVIVGTEIKGLAASCLSTCAVTMIANAASEKQSRRRLVGRNSCTVLSTEHSLHQHDEGLSF